MNKKELVKNDQFLILWNQKVLKLSLIAHMDIIWIALNKYWLFTDFESRGFMLFLTSLIDLLEVIFDVIRDNKVILCFSQIVIFLLIKTS